MILYLNGIIHCSQHAKKCQVIFDPILNVYLDLKSIGYIHERRIVGDQKAHEVLPSIHTILSNAKSFIAGTYHGLDKKHFQYYLDEFCYRFNRWEMHDELFSRLLLACLRKEKIFYRALIR